MAEGEEVVNAALVDLELKSGNFAKRWNFGSERQTAILIAHEQRLDAERVAGEAKASRLPIPDRGGIHSLGSKPDFVAPAEVAGKQCFDIALGPERISIAKVAAKLPVIDDLAVADDRVPIVPACDRLVPAIDVDDAEAAHSKAEIAVDGNAKIVRTAMNQAITLAGDDTLVDRPSASSVPTRNSAHCPAALAPVAPCLCG
jgi:hypothetical protein